jgi:hypothetical protein
MSGELYALFQKKSVHTLPVTSSGRARPCRRLNSVAWREHGAGWRGREGGARRARQQGARHGVARSMARGADGAFDLQRILGSAGSEIPDIVVDPTALCSLDQLWK